VNKAVLEFSLRSSAMFTALDECGLRGHQEAKSKQSRVLPFEKPPPDLTRAPLSQRLSAEPTSSSSGIILL